MTTEWRIVPKDTWRTETAQYLPRVQSATAVDPAVVAALSSSYPGVFWPETKPPRSASIASRLVIHAVGLFNLAVQIRSAIREQWLSGLFVIVPLTTRFVFETWGAIHFGRLTLVRLIREGDLDREEQRTDRLTLGSRSEVRLPWGGAANARSLNVLDFIKSLADVRSDAEDLYNFLSEASHPNFIQNAYFQMAGPPISNWENETFKGHAHSLLAKTLDAYESSTRGMEADVVAMLKAGTDYIEAGALA